MLPTLIQRYDKKIISCLIQFKKERLTEILQVGRCTFNVCINTIYQFVNFSWMKNVYFEEYGAFKIICKKSTVAGNPYLAPAQSLDIIFWP